MAITPDAGRFPMERPDLERELERHHRAAFGWALSCCEWDRAAAEDALQASYLRIVEGRARFQGRSSFATWLFGVIRRTAAEQRRRRALWRLAPLSWIAGRDQAREPGDDPETALTRSETSARLIEALGRLPARQREVLHLVFYQDLSIAEAAGALGVSVGTARTHYQRAKTRLRELLREEEHDARA